MSSQSLDKNLAKKHILVIDDQGSIRGVVKSYFINMGFTTIGMASDGKDGLQYLSQNAVDIVICDWQMPKISGIDLLQRVRAFPGTASLPFLMMTSTSDLDAVNSAVASGVSDYMIKPFQPTQLGFKVVKLLGKSSHTPCKIPVELASAVKNEQDSLDDSPKRQAGNEDEAP